MKIAIGSDHAGFELKEEIRKYLEDKGYEYVDCGVYNTDSADYPVQAKLTCDKIISGECDRGILCCGTGIGISIAANKVKGIRCGLCTNVEMAKLTRQHNDANMLAMGGRIIDDETAMAITEAFIDTEFEGGRHQRRIDKIEEA